MKDSLDRFQRDLFLKVFFAGQTLPPAKLFIPSDWYPPTETIPAELRVQMKQFRAHILRLFKPTPQCPPNLVPHQNRLLRALKESSGLLVVRTDKNLGPAIVDRTTYIHKAFTDHLSDKATYQSLTSSKARTAINELSVKLIVFIADNSEELGEAHRKFLLNIMKDVKDPYPHLYLTFKNP
jgi:hypothetical protein